MLQPPCRNYFELEVALQVAFECFAVSGFVADN